MGPFATLPVECTTSLCDPRCCDGIGLPPFPALVDITVLIGRWLLCFLDISSRFVIVLVCALAGGRSRHPPAWCWLVHVLAVAALELQSGRCIERQGL